MNFNQRKKMLEEEEKFWAQEKELLEREQKLINEKENFKKRNKKKISTSKLLIAFLFLNCTFIELFTGWVTVKSIFLSQMYGTSVDFSPLVTLIGAVVGEVIGYAVYSAKSAKENTVGGIVYDSVLNEQNNSVG